MAKVICRMCGKEVEETRYLPGMSKCLDCMELIKTTRRARPGTSTRCLRIIYDRFWDDGLRPLH